MNRQQLEQLARAAAAKYGVPVDWFFNLINHESGWNPQATNASSGAAGLGQFLPSTAAGYGVTTDQLRNDPALALEMSARLLSDNATVLGGDWAKAFAAYFVGVGNVQSAQSQGGAAWLPALDNIASQYGQGTVTAYLSAVGAAGGGSSTASTAYPASGQVGPNGRTVGEITGTPYQSPEERVFYLKSLGREDLLSPGELAMAATMGTLTPMNQATTTPGGTTPMTMQNPGELPPGAQIIGGNLATWTGPDGTVFYFQYNPSPFVDPTTGTFMPAGWNPRGTPQTPGPGGPGGPPQTQDLVGPDGQMHTYGYNPATGRFDIDYGLSAIGPAAGGPTGAVTREELIAAGADLSSPGIAILGNGAIYKLNPDGTYSVSSTPNPAEDQAILSGAGLARLFGDQPSGDLGQSLATGQATAPQTAGAPGGQVSASTNPMNNLFTQHQIAQAVSREGIEPGDVLGAAEPMFTGRAGPVPITFGGIYEGGGLTPVRGALAAGVPEFSGYMPPTAEEPWRTSIGFGMARPVSGQNTTFNPNYAALEGLSGGEQVDARLNLMALRQQAADTGLIMPNLAALKNAEARGTVAAGSYKKALASLSEGIGRPLSGLDLMAIPDPSPYRQTIQQGTKVGSRVYTPERYAELNPGSRPISFARGGSLTANRPMWVVDPQTGQQVAAFAENGPETVQFGGEMGRGVWQGGQPPPVGGDTRIPTRDQFLAERQPDLYIYDPLAPLIYGSGEGGGSTGQRATGGWLEPNPNDPYTSTFARFGLEGLDPSQYSNPAFDWMFRPDRAGMPNMAPRGLPAQRESFFAPQLASLSAGQRARETAAAGRAAYQGREQEANEEFFGKQPLDFGRPPVEEMRPSRPRRLNPAQIVQAMRT